MPLFTSWNLLGRLRDLESRHAKLAEEMGKLPKTSQIIKTPQSSSTSSWRSSEIAIEKMDIHREPAIRTTLHTSVIECVNQYALQTQVGKGSTSTIYRAVDLNLGTLVAVKMVKFTRKNTPQTELDALLRIGGHSYIVQLLEYITADRCCYFVFELCTGPLMEMVPGSRKVGYSEHLCIRYMRQIVLALEFIHDNGLIHQDIKPENILLTYSGEIRLADFGTTGPPGSCVSGTLPFMAPELVQIGSGSHASTATDIWSLGITLYCIACGYLPFDATNHVELINEIIQKPIISPTSMSSELKALLKGLICRDSQRRTCMNDLRTDPWLTLNGSLLLPSEHLISPASSIPSLLPTSGNTSINTGDSVADLFRSRRNLLKTYMSSDKLAFSDGVVTDS